MIRQYDQVSDRLTRACDDLDKNSDDIYTSVNTDNADGVHAKVTCTVRSEMSRNNIEGKVTANDADKSVLVKSADGNVTSSMSENYQTGTEIKLEGTGRKLRVWQETEANKYDGTVKINETQVK